MSVTVVDDIGPACVGWPRFSSEAEAVRVAECIAVEYGELYVVGSHVKLDRDGEVTPRHWHIRPAR